MERLNALLYGLYVALERREWAPRLVARLGIGLMFAGGAVKKARHLSDFVAYFQSLHIPAATLQAPFVVGVEFVGGLCLMLGLATRPAAAMLASTMVVALATAAIPEHHITASWQGLLEFLYLPEWLLLVMLGWFAVAGAGRAGLDHGLRRSYERSRAT
jgi:putative oxidoreductase